MHGPLVAAALAVLWLTCIYLVALGFAILTAPVRTHRFLAGFAQTARANWTECLLRILVGSAFIIAAPAVAHPPGARIFGAFLVGSAVLLALLAGTHRRFASSAIALVAPFLPLLGIASIAIGLMLALALA